MPPRKHFECKACKSKHIKPIDDECPFVTANDAEEGAGDNNVTQEDSEGELDVGTKILKELKDFSQRLEKIENKVQENKDSISKLNSPVPAAARDKQVAAPVIPTVAALQQ